ncbi:MAG: hypothetical protein RJQ21_00595 [Rhodospirillales bacterium]
MRSRLMVGAWLAWFVLVYGGYLLSSKDYYVVKIGEFLSFLGLG